MKNSLLLFFGIFLLGINTTAFGQTCNQERDSLALVSLYNATNGEEWRIKWDLKQPITTWKGVSTDENGCVTKLQLHSNKLNGTLPIELGNLKQLTLLNLIYNKLSGSIPSELGSLTQLQHLYLTKNNLSGEIPRSFENLVNLASITLNDNQLTGCFPTGLCFLTQEVQWVQVEGGFIGCSPAPVCQYDFSGNAGLPWGGDFLRFCNEGTQIGASCDDGNISTINDVIQSDCTCQGEVPENCPLVSVNITGIANFCANGSTILSADKTYSAYEWSNGATAKSIVANVAQTYSLTVVDEAGCTGTAFLSVQQLIPGTDCDDGNSLTENDVLLDNCICQGIECPEISVGFRGQTSFCEGSSININSHNFYSAYQWSSGATTREINVTVGQTYSLTVTDINGCTGVGSLSIQQLIPGTACDDGNVSTKNDILIEDCTCRGESYAVEECRLRDSLILVDLYNSTDGDNWRRHDNWLSDEPLENWLGIETDENGCVGIIRLSTNKLIGDIPSSLGNMSQLNHLFLNDNSLTGTIPVELGNMQQLVYLNLVGNELHGSIPKELEKLSQLNQLLLTLNELSGSIPIELANLSKLTHLNLAGNSLEGTIPIELTNMSQLTHLFLSGNRLSGAIPSELANLNNLTYLGLDYNKFTGVLPKELSKLTQLISLSISNNSLSGNIPAEFGAFNQLTRLNLSDNNLSGPIPVELSNLVLLTYINFSENNLSGSIPGELSNLVLLTYIDLSDNNLSGPIPAELSNLTNLRSLYLQDNQLSGCIPSEFSVFCRLNRSNILYMLNNSGLPWGGRSSNFCRGEQQVGASCNDGDDTSEGDVIQSDCTCKGTTTTECSDVAVLILGNPNFCEGDYTILSADQMYTDYQWSNGATAQSMVADRTQNYELTVTDAKGCIGVTSLLVQEVQIGMPCDDANTNTVDDIIQEDCTCKGKMPFQDSDISTERSSNYGIHVFPNPSSGQIRLQIAGNVKSLNIKITNIRGQVIQSLEGNQHQYDVDLTKQEAGVYFVQVISETEVQTRRLVVCKS